MPRDTIHIGSRKSQLAIVQSTGVREDLNKIYPDLEFSIKTLETLGDQVQFKPLYSFGGKALWTKELEDYLYHQDESMRLDLIVHSLKDMPTILPDGFELGAVTKREDPSDCVVMAKGSKYTCLEDLPEGGIVGTSSVRRSAQLKRKYPNLKFESVRGNIQTRLNKLDDPATPYHCLVLASAGLLRMNLGHRITVKLDSNIMYHAVGQGALGIEIRSNDTKIKELLTRVADHDATICCLAERSLMRTLEGGCSVPLGVETSYDSSARKLIIKGLVVNVDGTEAIEDSIEYVINDINSDPVKAGEVLAQKMIVNGAKTILDEINLTKVEQ